MALKHKQKTEQRDDLKPFLPYVADLKRLADGEYPVLPEVIIRALAARVVAEINNTGSAKDRR